MLPDDLAQSPVTDVASALDACRGAALEREGIAMYVALPDARPGRSESPAALNDEGPRLSKLFEHYHRALEVAGSYRAAHQPPERPDATAEASDLIDVLVVLGEHHLHARPQSSTAQ